MPLTYDLEGLGAEARHVSKPDFILSYTSKKSCKFKLHRTLKKVNDLFIAHG